MTPPAKPGGLIVPGNPGSQSSAPDAATLNRETPVTRVFRPPPGFMDDESGAAGREKSEMPPQEMLNRLQAQAGAWHQLARFLPTLHREGFDGYVIEEATGLERKLQNIWTSAVSIYDSLVKSNSVEPSVMSYYDAPGGEMLLHELRFLSTPQRTVAVTYIAENEFDTAQCAVLAKAMKEHERRGGRREGFTDSPADCLAYKYYRDALECRKVEDIETCVQKGLKVVESDEARAKLVRWSCFARICIQNAKAVRKLLADKILPCSLPQIFSPGIAH